MMTRTTDSVHPAKGPSYNGDNLTHATHPAATMTPKEAEFFLGAEAAALLDQALSGKSRPLRLRTERD